MKYYSFLIIVLLLSACVDRKTEIESAMRQYDHLTFRMNGDSLADTYTTNGVLGGKGMGKYISRDSIRKF